MRGSTPSNSSGRERIALPISLRKCSPAIATALLRSLEVQSTIASHRSAESAMGSIGTPCLVSDAGHQTAGVGDEEALHHRRQCRERLEKRGGPNTSRVPDTGHLALEALEVEVGPSRRDRNASGL